MNGLDRRTFLRSSLCSTAAIISGRPMMGRAEQVAVPIPCSPDSWKKHGIILEATEPWEGSEIQNFTTPAESLENGVWRIWYSVSGGRKKYKIAWADGIPGEPMKKVCAVCSPGQPADAPFAIGNLPEGLNLVQPIHIRLHTGKHRLYFWAHGPDIGRYLAAESDDGRRYRVIDPLRPVLYHPNDRAACGIPLPDGNIFRRAGDVSRPSDEPPAVTKLLSNDATNVYQMPDGTFELYSVGLVRVPRTDPAYVVEDNAPGLLRVIDRYTSQDGLHFENRRQIIQRDEHDPVDQQFYYLAVTQTPKGRVGMLGHYRCKAQTMDLEWCFSLDGIHWDRPRRKAWLPRGNPPAPDSYGLYANNQLVHHNGQWHLFYTGTNSSHNGKDSYGKPRQVIMHATTDSIWG